MTEPRTYGVCSECPNRLTSPNAKTCTKKCRSARSRRIARTRRSNGENSALPAHLKGLSMATRGEVKDIAHDVLKEELRPVAREMLTEDVLRSLGDLIRLTPTAIANLELDLSSSDERIRSKATELLLRYTLGNQSIAPTASNNPVPMQVVLNWPGAPVAEVAPAELEVPEADVVEDPHHEDYTLPLPAETRECAECHETKPESAFVGASDRCQACHETVLNRVRERFGEGAV